MRRIIMFALLSLTMFGGVASADRHGSFGRDHRGGVYVHPRSGYRFEARRRPIFVQRPVIRHRYFNFYSRPGLIVENYPPITGYYWVRGHWAWDGYEWIWTPGYYQPAY